MSVIHDTDRILSTGLIGIGNIRRIGKYPFFPDSRFYVAITLHPSAPCGALKECQLSTPTLASVVAFQISIDNGPTLLPGVIMANVGASYKRINLHNSERKKRGGNRDSYKKQCTNCLKPY